MPTHACPTCGAPAHATALRDAPMGAGDVVVRVSGLARVRCDDGHAAVVPADATAVLLDAIARQLPTAATRGVLRRQEICVDCGEALVLPPRRTERAVPEQSGGHVVTAHVEAPMVRCPACAREQLTAAAARAVPTVLAASVEAAGIS